MMLKISQKMRHTKSTFMIEGIAPTRAFTTTLMPSNRDKALRGLKALNVRRDLMAPSSE